MLSKNRKKMWVPLQDVFVLFQKLRALLQKLCELLQKKRVLLQKVCLLSQKVQPILQLCVHSYKSVYTLGLLQLSAIVELEVYPVDWNIIFVYYTNSWYKPLNNNFLL